MCNLIRKIDHRHCGRGNAPPLRSLVIARSIATWQSPMATQRTATPRTCEGGQEIVPLPVILSDRRESKDPFPFLAPSQRGLDARRADWGSVLKKRTTLPPSSPSANPPPSKREARIQKYPHNLLKIKKKFHKNRGKTGE